MKRIENIEGKKNRKRMIVCIAVGIVAVLVLLYIGIAIYYRSHFLPGTRINNLDCGNRSVEEVSLLLEKQTKEYSVEVVGRNWEDAEENEPGHADTVLGTIRAEDVGLTAVNVAEGVQALLEGQGYLLWVKAFAGEEKNHELLTGYDLDEALMEKVIRSWKGFQKNNMTEPKDAYIREITPNAYESTEAKTGVCYEIVEETAGTQINIETALEVIKQAILAKKESVNLETEGCYETASVTADNKKLQESCDTANKWVQTAVTYDWNGNQVILAGEQIQKWISWENGEPVLDEDEVTEFVALAAAKYDTYGKKRKFVTAQGVELTLPSGAFGWKTDRLAETEELTELIYQGIVTEREPVYAVRGAAKGENDIGSSYVEIDLSNQHLYLFENGEIVLETDFVSGDMTKAGRMTPPGVFGLTYKTRNAVLRGENYETPVNYWMPFNGNVGMHDATWRRSFGGDIYIGNGSHGCVNLPLDKAKEIYEYVSTGFPVICYYY